jgi:hypothetical protein
MVVISVSFRSAPMLKILLVEMTTHCIANSRSIELRLYISLKSNRSNRTERVYGFCDLHLILSSALESAKVIKPAKSSRASIKPKDMSVLALLTVVVGVPNGKSRLIRRENGFKFSEIDCKVVAD